MEPDYIVPRAEQPVGEIAPNKASGACKKNTRNIISPPTHGNFDSHRAEPPQMRRVFAAIIRNPSR